VTGPSTVISKRLPMRTPVNPVLPSLASAPATALPWGSSSSALGMTSTTIVGINNSIEFACGWMPPVYRSADCHSVGLVSVPRVSDSDVGTLEVSCVSGRERGSVLGDDAGNLRIRLMDRHPVSARVPKQYCGVPRTDVIEGKDSTREDL